MSVDFVLFLLVLASLVGVWAASTLRQPATTRRTSADYRHQQTENPDYFPGHGGGQAGI